MLDDEDFAPQPNISDLLVAQASEHAKLADSDVAALREVHARKRVLTPGDDVVHQGERPAVAVMVLEGMLARYHTLSSGERQYLSFHLRGNLPDIQSLFLHVMDHSLCALDEAVIAVFPHDQMRRMFLSRPNVALAFWRLTLVDAAVFRQAITSNGARSHTGRLAHLFCEIIVRAREAHIANGWSCALPLSQGQLGQALGMSHISVNRAMQWLRRERLVEFRKHKLEVLDWTGLARIAGFDPTYLHIDR